MTCFLESSNIYVYICLAFVSAWSRPDYILKIILQLLQAVPLFFIFYSSCSLRYFVITYIHFVPSGKLIRVVKPDLFPQNIAWLVANYAVQHPAT